MADLAHWWGNDLSVGATGDLLPIDDLVRGQQRVLRRLLTVPGSYIWHPEYGAGLQLYIGDPVDPETIGAIVRQQVLLEAAVAADPEPQVTVTPFLNGMTVSIVYTDAPTGRPTTLQFDVTE